MTQAKILFSSPRFAAQDLVVLVASSGEFYRLAVLSRGHDALSTLPPRDDIEDLIISHEEDLKVDDVTGDLSSELVVLSGTPTEREQQRLAAKHEAEKEATEKQIRARKARATARSKRKDGLCNAQGLTRTLSQIVIDAGDPPYSDDWIERCHEVNWKIKESSQIRLFQQYPEFFEREPQPHESLSTLANLRNPNELEGIVFTGVIRIGSPASEKFFQVIQRYLSDRARQERSRRDSII